MAQLNQWQRLFVATGSIGFIIWTIYVVQTDDSPHPEVSFLAAVVLAVWAASNKREEEPWLPWRPKIQRGHVLTIAVILIALISLKIVSELQLEVPSEAATEMAYDTQIDAQPIPTGSTSIPPYFQELVSKMQKDKSVNDPVARTVDAMVADGHDDLTEDDDPTAAASTNPDSQQ